MATTTISDLPTSRALDYRAMRAIKGSGGAPWVFGAFRPFMRPTEAIVPIIFNQVNFIAEQLTLQFQNINVENTGDNSNINLNAGQNSISMNIAPTLMLPQP